MSRLYLVRHGQAAFHADDYDQLTDTGVAQCERLARHWQAIGRRVDIVFAGQLRRQRDSAEAFLRTLHAAGPAPDGVRLLPGLEEYDHRGLLEALDGDPGRTADGDRAAFHRRLSRALEAWVAGELAGVEPFAAFRERCVSALHAALQETGRGRSAVLFASAGSLAAALQPALGIGDRELMRLKLNFYNTGVSSLLSDGESLTIESLNAIGHLEVPGCGGLITHR